MLRQTSSGVCKGVGKKLPAEEESAALFGASILMEVAPGAPNLGQTPASHIAAQNLPHEGRGPLLLPTQSPASTETPLVLLCKKTTPQCREPAWGWIHTLWPSWTQEERTHPKERCSAKAQGRERPTVEVNHLEIGSILHRRGGFGLFLPFFELSFCCRAPPAPSGCKAGVTGPGRSPPLRSTPPNPRCQRILPQPDTSLDPLPVTSSSTLHLSS